MSKHETEDKPRKGIYLLPNLFTTAALFAGFYAIVAAMQGKFALAAISVFIAMIWDGLDGRIARLTNTQTEFGVQYDSLSDMVSFGLTPALLLYQWGLQDLGKVGWLAAFLYAASTALRLARFNTQAAVADKRFFQGLPCPAAAGVVAGLIWFCHNLGVPGDHLRFLAVIVSVSLASLMVSNVRYYSFKKMDMKGKVPFVVILLVVLLFVAVALNPAQNLFFIFGAFALSGPVLTIIRAHQLRGIKRKKHQEVEEESDLD